MDNPEHVHPFPRSVEAFEEVLKRAHAEQVAAFAIITVDPAGIVGWRWHFGARPQTDLIGGIACMQWAITTNAMQPPPAPPQPIPMPDVAAPPTETRQ